MVWFDGLDSRGHQVKKWCLFKCFLLITFDLWTMGSWFYIILFLLFWRVEICIVWPWKVNFKIWPSVKVTCLPTLIQIEHIEYQSMRLDVTNTMGPFPCLYYILIKSYKQKTFGDLGWPQMTFNGIIDQKLRMGHHEWLKITWSWKNYADLMRILWMRTISIFAHWLMKVRLSQLPDLRSPIQKYEIYKF